MMEQTIVMSLNDITRISVHKREGSINWEAQSNEESLAAAV